MIVAKTGPKDESEKTEVVELAVRKEMIDSCNITSGKGREKWSCCFLRVATQMNFDSESFIEEETTRNVQSCSVWQKKVYKLLIGMELRYKWKSGIN